MGSQSLAFFCKSTAPSPNDEASADILIGTLALYNRAETRSGHPSYPGQLGHVMSRSSGYDLVYKVSRPEPDSALDHMR